jgi:hypothetical protein
MKNKHTFMRTPPPSLVCWRLALASTICPPIANTPAKRIMCFFARGATALVPSHAIIPSVSIIDGTWKEKE